MRYRDLNGRYGELVGDLTRGRLTADDWCHLDPDINADSIPRSAGWRGALGQEAAAQGHLANQQVAPGDIFIFWGLFRPVEHNGRWRFTGRPEHRIWGWLQIDEIIHLGADGSHALTDRPWLQAHPHTRPGWKHHNALYVASEQLRLPSKSISRPGYGVLKRGFRLSVPGENPSVWEVPDWLHPLRGGSGMTYHPPQRWNENGTVTCAARGQEFVASPTADRGAVDWLTTLLDEP
jgi:hypothetical protein